MDGEELRIRGVPSGSTAVRVMDEEARAVRRHARRVAKLTQKRRRVLTKKESQTVAAVARRTRAREGRAPWMCVAAVVARLALRASHPCARALTSASPSSPARFRCRCVDVRLTLGMVGLPIVAKPQWPLPAEGGEGWVGRNVAVGVGPMHCFVATRRALIRTSTKVAHTGGRISFLQLRSGRGWVPEFEPATGERLVAIQPDGIGRRRTWSYRYLRKPGADPVQIRAGPWLATFPHGASAARRTGFDLKSGDHLIDERVILSTMVPRALWDLAHGRTPSAAGGDSAAEAEAPAPAAERADVGEADAAGAAPHAAASFAGAAEGGGMALAPAAAASPHDAVTGNAAAAPRPMTAEALLDELFPPAELRATPSPSGVTAIPSVASGVEVRAGTSGGEARVRQRARRSGRTPSPGRTPKRARTPRPRARTQAQEGSCCSTPFLRGGSAAMRAARSMASRAAPSPQPVRRRSSSSASPRLRWPGIPRRRCCRRVVRRAPRRAPRSYLRSRRSCPIRSRTRWR